MSVELDAAFDGVETFTEMEALFKDAEVELVIVDHVWNGRHVTSPHHPGFIELAEISQRVMTQFQTKGCQPEDAEAMKQLCERVTEWFEETDDALDEIVRGDRPVWEFYQALNAVGPELEGKSLEQIEAILVERGIMTKEAVAILMKDYQTYEFIDDCDFLFDEDDDPSLWFTKESWNYQFPGVMMPHPVGRFSSYMEGLSGEEISVSFSIFAKAQIEALRTQMHILPAIGA